jgi:hypothetical protein
MDIKTSNALMTQAKFAVAQLIEDAWEDAMKDFQRMNKTSPEKSFPLNLTLKFSKGTNLAVIESKASWGVRKTVEAEPVSITLEGDMFGDIG